MKDRKIEQFQFQKCLILKYIVYCKCVLPCFFSVFLCKFIYCKNSGKGQKFDFAGDLENGVAPRIPAKRIGKPDDIAGTAVYMCSRAGDFLLGATIPLDGGTVYGTLQG